MTKYWFWHMRHCDIIIAKSTPIHYEQSIFGRLFREWISLLIINDSWCVAIHPISAMILVLLENIWYQLWYMFCERTVGMSWYKLCKRTSDIRHDMNITYQPWYVREYMISAMIYVSVWEYLISAMIYQVCSVREHLIEVMIHFCKKTWYQPWYVFC